MFGRKGISYNTASILSAVPQTFCNLMSNPHSETTKTNASLLELLTQVQQGHLTATQAELQIQQLEMASRRPVDDSLDHVSLDLDRQQRCGFPEVAYGPGKSIETLVGIFQKLSQAGQSALATRLDENQSEALQQSFPRAIANSNAKTVRLMAQAGSTNQFGKVLVVTAGTTDLPVAEEAVETLLWMGCPVELMTDIGVAGPQRLLNATSKLQQASAIVVAAGMEGALPSVVGGWVSVPVIAVPTSVGYGANLGGMSALLSSLNSCASNVCVVNIDAGFKGGYLAGLIARQKTSEGEADG